MSTYDSDSDDYPSPPARSFGHRRPLHAILGGGNVADILLWKNKKLSAAILVAFTVIWFLFEVMEYQFITLLCHILCVVMIIIFIWSKAAGLIKMYPPSIDEIKLSESTCRSLFGQVNWLLLKFYDISSGKDLKLYSLTLVLLWILAALGEYFTSLSLLYTVFLCLETLPALYVRFQGEVDYLAGKSTRDMHKLFNNFNSKVLDKIPRAQGKDNKFM